MAGIGARSRFFPLATSGPDTSNQSRATFLDSRSFDRRTGSLRKNLPIVVKTNGCRGNRKRNDHTRQVGGGTYETERRLCLRAETIRRSWGEKSRPCHPRLTSRLLRAVPFSPASRTIASTRSHSSSHPSRVSLRVTRCCCTSLFLHLPAGSLRRRHLLHF